MTTEELENFFKQFDPSGKGQLKYDQWVVAATAQQNLLNDKKLQAAFNKFDTDGSGKISHQELKSVLSYNRRVSDTVIQ